MHQYTTDTFDGSECGARFDERRRIDDGIGTRPPASASAGSPKPTGSVPVPVSPRQVERAAPQPAAVQQAKEAIKDGKLTPAEAVELRGSQAMRDAARGEKERLAPRVTPGAMLSTHEQRVRDLQRAPGGDADAIRARIDHLAVDGASRSRISSLQQQHQARMREESKVADTVADKSAYVGALEVEKLVARTSGDAPAAGRIDKQVTKVLESMERDVTVLSGTSRAALLERVETPVPTATGAAAPAAPAAPKESAPGTSEADASAAAKAPAIPEPAAATTSPAPTDPATAAVPSSHAERAAVLAQAQQRHLLPSENTSFNERGEAVYTVQRNDSYWRIADMSDGRRGGYDLAHFGRTASANSERLGRDLQSALIHPGEQLVLPGRSLAELVDMLGLQAQQPAATPGPVDRRQVR